MIIIVDSNGDRWPTDAIEWVSAKVANLGGGRMLVGGGTVTDMSERTVTSPRQNTVQINVTRYVTVEYQITATVVRTLTREIDERTVTKERTVSVNIFGPTVTAYLTQVTAQYISHENATGVGCVTRDITVTADTSVTAEATAEITVTSDLTHWNTPVTSWTTKCEVTKVVTA